LLGLSLAVGEKCQAAETNTFFFACTATDSAGLESDYSMEVGAEVVGLWERITLAWDACDGVELQIVDGIWQSVFVGIDHYTLYWGPSSRGYTRSRNVGTNLVATVFVVAPDYVCPPSYTNLAVTVTGDELETATNILGPWTPAASVTVTNPMEPARFWRGVGAQLSARRFD
jgi:hypothetical protein